jgi:hypothetical protein
VGTVSFCVVGGARSIKKTRYDYHLAFFRCLWQEKRAME